MVVSLTADNACDTQREEKNFRGEFDKQWRKENWEENTSCESFRRKVED